MNVVVDNRLSAQPQISIVTPTFNGRKFVSSYLAALEMWKRPNVEVIVVDGGSDDGTIELLKASTGIDLLVSEKDDGIFDAMNKGVSLSRGSYIGILNLDDRYMPNTIDLITTSISSYSNSVIYGGLKIGDDDENVARLSHKNIHKGMIGHPAMFISKKLYQVYGVYNPLYKVAADYDLTFRYFNAGVNFIELPEVITEYTPGGFSSSHETLSIIETTKIQSAYNGRGIIWFAIKVVLRISKHQLMKLVRR